MAEKVLIVDDDVQTLRLVGLMLERQGYKILAANNGKQALHMARTEQPDVIILDVMMPDIDGYEVTRRLRKEPETTNIPILMFTARTQVDDKVSGFESGVDDYLTKPIHPAELTAHLRALMSRSKARSLPSKELGYVAGVLSAKGGVGVSTVALNLAIAYQQKTKAEVIAAETRPGQGTWAIELGSPNADGLGNLLRMPPGEISAITVENELARVPYGVRLLMASHRAVDASVSCAEEQIGAIAENLRLLARLILLDIGNSYGPFFDTLLQNCDELIVVTEPYPVSVQRTRQLLADLQERGFGRTKPVSLVSVNRVRADVQLSMMQMQETLGIPVTQVFPPAPEHAFQSANRGIPLMQVQIGGVISHQFLNMAEKLMQRVPA